MPPKHQISIGIKTAEVTMENIIQEEIFYFT
jgi:hypothetical protein